MASSSWLERLRIWAPVAAAVTGSVFLLACTESAASSKKKKTPIDYSDDFFNNAPEEEEPPPINPDGVNEDSGAFGTAKERPAPPPSSSSSGDAGVVIKTDGGTTSSSGSSGTTTKTYCQATGAVAAGDLAVVEIMVASKTGSGDSGEWVEIQNTHADCWLKLKGVTVESPRGAAAPNVATITDDFELGPNASFVVADSADPTKNHGITGKVLSWESTDVLKNDGDTVTIKANAGAIQVDTVTYPAFSNLTPGRALSFPSDCAWTDRASWDRWSLTFTEYSAGFKGTPNTDNNDVVCF